MVLNKTLTNLLVLSALFLLSSCEKNKFEKGIELYANSSYQEAHTAFTSYIETHPKHAKSYYNRGRTLEKLGKMDEAVADYQRAVNFNPLELTYKISAGLANFKLKKYGQVVLDMNAIIKQNPHLAEAYYIRGRAFTQQGKSTEAMKDFNTAINHDAGFSAALLHRGILKVLLKDNASGCADLNKAKSMGEGEASNYLEKYCR